MGFALMSLPTIQIWFAMHLALFTSHFFFVISIIRHKHIITANDKAKRAHKRDWERNREAGRVKGDYEPLQTTFDLAVRWLANFLRKHHFDIKKFLRFVHNFLDFSGVNNDPSLAKRNCAFFYGSSNSGV